MAEKRKQEERLQYHIVPPHGLLNDPNGLSFFRGRHHIFYQWNQTGTEHKNKSWGHVSTADFINWETHPPALEPADWYDKDGCYSGSAVVHEDQLYLFYTGNVRNAAGERESYQCAAVSADGVHFKKLGPVMEHPEGYTAHIRDPKVWKDGDGKWKMILGAQTLSEKGTALLYESDDLRNWELVGDIGKDLPEMGFMWECPDLIRLADSDLLLFCPQGIELDKKPNENFYQSGYLTGNLHGDGKLELSSVPFRKIDHGFEFYAPQTYQDPSGRHIMFGWLGLMRPEDEQHFPSVEEGYIHALTIPRVLSLTEGELIQEPLPELRELRMSAPCERKNQQEFKLQLASFQNEMKISWKEAPSFQLCIRNEVEISYQSDKQEIILERTNWVSGKREKRTIPLGQPLQEMSLYLENSSLEIFFNQGRKTASMRYVADETADEISYRQEEAGENQFTLYELQPYEGILPKN